MLNAVGVAVTEEHLFARKINNLVVRKRAFPITVTADAFKPDVGIKKRHVINISFCVAAVDKKLSVFSVAFDYVIKVIHSSVRVRCGDNSHHTLRIIFIVLLIILHIGGIFNGSVYNE